MIQVIDSIPWVRCASGNVFIDNFPYYVARKYFACFARKKFAPKKTVPGKFKVFVPLNISTRVYSSFSRCEPAKKQPSKMFLDMKQVDFKYTEISYHNICTKHARVRFVRFVLTKS